MSKISGQVICEDVKGNKYPVNIDQLAFRPAVYGVIIQDGKILLSKQWDGYDFPGGGIELGEGTLVALKREVKEETGFDVKIGEIIYADNSFFKTPFENKFVHSIHLYYECKIIGGEITTEFFDKDEKNYASEAEWVDLAKIGQIKIYSSVGAKKILAEYLEK
jgi:8-oxo-dGTP pyrophosphatase MutT (NUDIX family)